MCVIVASKELLTLNEDDAVVHVLHGAVFVVPPRGAGGGGLNLKEASLNQLDDRFMHLGVHASHYTKKPSHNNNNTLFYFYFSIEHCVFWSG